MKLMILMAAFAMLCSCAQVRPFITNSVPSTPDYAKKSSWAALPGEKDNADRIPKGDFQDEQAGATVDVFFIHPTIYLKKKAKAWNAALDDQKLNNDVDESTILYQASAFNGVGRVFAPRYRQAHYRSFTSDDTTSSRLALDLAYSDVKAAFEYFLKNKNESRPIIIAAHSQGTLHAKRLLAEFFDNKTLKNRLVAAYLVGWPIQKNAFKTIPPCETPEQTGCFCSWRSYLHGYTPEGVLLGDKIAVTNPLTWKMDEKPADKSLNDGMIARKFESVLPQRADAQAVNGILWVNKPKFPGSFFFRQKNYHIADYNLFYINIRKNAKYREGLFWK